MAVLWIVLFVLQNGGGPALFDAHLGDAPAGDESAQFVEVTTWGYVSEHNLIRQCGGELVAARS
jgi:hypothetical protein